jgi:hypothetical protein
MNPDNNTKQTNKKLIIGILAGVGVLLLILIGLVVALLVGQNNDKSENANQNTSSQSESADSDNDASSESKEIVKRVATNNDKFEIVFYKPEQKGSNTTFEFGIRNKCDGCEKREFASAYNLMGLVAEQAYLIDEEAGKKYSVITDADDTPLATKNCNAYVEPGKTLDCFVSFTKVPSGSTVSFVTNNQKFDDLKVE